LAPMGKNDYNWSPPKVHIYESSNHGTKIYYCIDVAKKNGDNCVSHERIYQFIWEDKRKKGTTLETEDVAIKSEV
jgi:hypothetical protein